MITIYQLNAYCKNRGKHIKARAGQLRGFGGEDYSWLYGVDKLG